jgi:hypothetical protein
MENNENHEERLKYVSARIYNTLETGFVFPEETDESIKNRENFGIAFSGGGTRSVSMTMGQLRALDRIGILDSAKYMSAVSGGSWGSFPFVYLDGSIADELYYGPFLNPDQINTSDLECAPDFSLTKAIDNATFIDKILPELDFGHDLYAQIVSKIILSPFKIGDQRKFFTLNQGSLDKILAINSNLKASDFYLVNRKKNRPFFIAGATLIRPNFNRYQLEMTPLYIGVNALFAKAGADGRYDIGGGYVEPQGFNTDSPESIQENVARLRLGKLKNMFNLGDLVGASSSAASEFAKRFGLGWLGFPEFKYWGNFKNPVDTHEKEYDFGDGGILENLAIMPLLKRKVEKIIVFVNCQTPLTGADETQGQITDSIPALFYPLNHQNGSGKFESNIVFANQKDKYQQLVNDLKVKIQNGQPPIHINTYKVTKQPHYNITEEYDVQVMWVYNATVKEWEDKLKPDVKKLLKTSAMFKNFPYYKTFMENSPEVLALRPAQSNLLAHLSSWIVDSNKGVIEGFLKGKEILNV